MLRPTNVTMIHVSTNRPHTGYPHVPRGLPLCCHSFSATVCGGHDDIGEGRCFTCPFWMLRPTNTAMEHLSVGSKTEHWGVAAKPAHAVNAQASTDEIQRRRAPGLGRQAGSVSPAILRQVLAGDREQPQDHQQLLDWATAAERRQQPQVERRRAFAARAREQRCQGRRRFQSNILRRVPQALSSFPRPEPAFRANAGLGPPGAAYVDELRGDATRHGPLQCRSNRDSRES
jgi:hypothetical protein